MADIEESSTHTRSVKYHLKHTWVIDNFSHFYVENAEGTDSEYPEILSAPFKCSTDKRIKFKIALNPKGNAEESQDYISVFLNMKFKEAAKVLLSIKLSILDASNKKAYSQEMTRLFTKSIYWGWPDFVERTVFLDPTTGLLVNDQLTILCEIVMYSEPISKLTSDVSLQALRSLSMLESSEMFGALLESGHHSDVVLVFDGGKELKAHKNILSARSPVFMAMFKADMKENAEGRVVIEDLTFAVAKELLTFIYTGKVALLASTAEGLLTAAEKYGLALLKQLCGQYLCGKVTGDNVARFLALAEAHSVDKLKRTCINYIRVHLMEVMLTQDWPLVDKLVIEELRQEKLAQEGVKDEAQEGGEDEAQEGVEDEAQEGVEDEAQEGVEGGETEE